MDANRPKGSFAAASWICAVDIARNAASDDAPTLAANLAPSSSACASGTGGSVGAISAPLSPIAPAMRFFESGDAICALTAIDPADSPAMVTFFGSPPKAAIFFWTHCSAAF